jgi:hypothetical protein
MFETEVYSVSSVCEDVASLGTRGQQLDPAYPFRVFSGLPDRSKKSFSKLPA